MNDPASGKEGVVLAGGLNTDEVRNPTSHFFNLRTKTWKTLGNLRFGTGWAGQKLLVMQVRDS